MILTPKALDLIEMGTIYHGEFSTDRNHKGIFLEICGLNVNTLYVFKADDFGHIAIKTITTDYDLANCFPTTEDHLLKMMRAKFGIETKRRARASYASSLGESICADTRKQYITQYSVR